MAYQGFTDEDLIDTLYLIDQSMPIADQFDRAFITNMLETYESYGKAAFSDKQREVILSLKEKYISA